MKQIFTVSTLEDNECIPKRSGVKSKFMVADLIKVQTSLQGKLEAMIVILKQKDAEITTLKVVSMKGHEEALD